MADYPSCDPRSIFDKVQEFSNKVHAIDEERARLKVLQNRVRRECGTCQHWMVSSRCPREKLLPNGRYEGPSCSGYPCEKYTPTAAAIAASQEMRAAAGGSDR